MLVRLLRPGDAAPDAPPVARAALPGGAWLLRAAEPLSDGGSAVARATRFGVRPAATRVGLTTS
jgi:hypothetical protein